MVDYEHAFINKYIYYYTKLQVNGDSIHMKNSKYKKKEILHRSHFSMCQCTAYHLFLI